MNPFGLSQSLVDAALQVHKEAMSPDANVKTVPTKKNDKDVNLRKREKEIAGSHKANVQKEETVAEALKGGQKKLDKNHNGKLDSDDFKKLRKEETVPFEGPYEKKGPAKTKNVAKNAARKAMKKIKTSMDKGVKEEVEQVDESPFRSRQSLAGMQREIALKKRQAERAAGTLPKITHINIMDKGKLVKRVPIDKKTNEEVEQVDELKKSTLASYVNKSAQSMGHASWKAGQADTKNYKEFDKHNRTIDKRAKGIKTATDKLRKEEVQFTPEELERIEAIVGTNK